MTLHTLLLTSCDYRTQEITNIVSLLSTLQQLYCDNIILISTFYNNNNNNISFTKNQQCRMDMLALLCINSQLFCAVLDKHMLNLISMTRLDLFS